MKANMIIIKKYFFLKKYVSNDVSNGNTKSAELVVVLFVSKNVSRLKEIGNKKVLVKSTSKIKKIKYFKP